MYKIIFCISLFLMVTTKALAQPTVGTVVPNITLKNNKNVDVSLSSLKGKVVLIDFWASWCKPCRASMPKLKELFAKYNAKGFEIYSISLDDNYSAWLAAIKEDKTKWTHVIDNTGGIADNWNILFIPYTFLLSKDQKLIAINLSVKELENKIISLL